ncbi:MAG: AsmA family protein [Gammaproteobacteria bacterium]|nr:AsmA family protein [Gammaproteobacteria bacterium]
MNKLVRGLGWGIGIALAVIATAMLGIILFVDPNDFKDDITQAVKDATGRELVLTGDIELSVFPWLGLTLGTARLSNAPGFDAEDFARVASVDIRVKLLPLLKQRVEMKTLQLHGLQVNLSRARDGRSNWDDLLAAPDPASSAVHGGVSPLAALAIGGVNIEDAQIHWDDRQAGQRIDVEKFNLRTGAIAPRLPIDIRLSTQLSVSEPALQTPVTMQAQLTLDPESQRYRLEGLDLSLNLHSELLPVSPLAVGLTADAEADLAPQAQPMLKVTALQLRTLGVTANGTMQLQQDAVMSQAKGELSVATFSPRELLKALGIAPPETADAGVLDKASAKLAFVGSPQALAVNGLELLLDDSKLTGSLQVKDFSRPAISFDVALDGIDADRYLPPATDAPPPSPSAAVVASTQLPLELLRELDVKGDLRVNKLVISRAHISDIVYGITAKGGQIRLSPAQANLYQGRYSGNIALDVRKDTPVLSADEKLSEVHVGPLLKDMLGDDKASGTASLMAKVSANGLTPEAILQSLNGTASFQLADGAVKGVNLGQLIREAYARIKGKPAPPKTTNVTDFAAMSGSVDIRNGVLHNQDLQAKSPLLRIAGRGKVDLPRQKIDYLLNTSIVETDQGQAGEDLSELKGLTIPVKITGSFDQPKFALDLQPIIKARAEEKLKRQKARLEEKADKKLDEKKDELKKKAEDALKDKLKRLF